VTGAQALANAIKRLKSADVPDAANDASILLAHALKIERGRLILVLPDEMDTACAKQFETAISARCQRQPVSQIIGSRAFYGRDFIVTSDVLDPRPDTELLIEAALAKPFKTVLDLGTGSGCILLTLLAENQHSSGVGTDISPKALSISNKNAAGHNLTDRSKFLLSDWFGQITERFDLIVSNPPYITVDEMSYLAPELRKWEPEIALSPGGDGLAAYQVIIASACRYLSDNGRLIVEIGHKQALTVSAMFEAAGFQGINILKDINGRDRVVSGALR
jgi:release factor glutamine methyltransferase